MNILIDMNLSPRWVAFLADAGIHALHWSSVGPPNASDREIMHWAKENNCIVMTHDLDFSAILAATQGAKPSVVQIRGDDISPEAIGQKIGHQPEALHRRTAHRQNRGFVCAGMKLGRTACGSLT